MNRLPSDDTVSIGPSTDSAARLRRGVYVILIAVSAGAMLGRLLSIDSVDKYALEEMRLRDVLGAFRTLDEYREWKRQDLAGRGLSGDELETELAKAVEAKRRQVEQRRLRRPFLSANDRSRWATVRVLVEPDLRVPGAPYAIDKVIQEPGWDTIDMVKHARRYDPAEAASETAAAGAATRDERPWRQKDGHLYSSKPPLLATLVAGEYWLVHRLTGWTLGEHPYLVGRLILATVNVVPLLVAFALLARLAERFGTTDWGRCFVMAAATFGTFLTTFAVTLNNHLPAAVCALVALDALVRVEFDDERRLRYFVTAGLFGALAVACELPAVALVAPLTVILLWKAPREFLLGFVPAAVIVAAGFFGTNWIAHRSLVPPYLHRGGGGPDDWYDYTYLRNGREIESYWRNPRGVDAGEPSWPKYALHVLAGHHGVFSLTPVWLLSAAGAAGWIVRGRDGRVRRLAILIAAASLVVLAFYLQPQKGSDYRNYGGVASGLRWMFWFAPAWLLLMLPAADWMAQRRWARGLAVVLLVISVLSVSYPTWNPWVQPWLMDAMGHLGWL